MKKFRTFLLLITVLFVALHLFLLSHGDDGLYDMLQGHRAQAYPSALVWAGWETEPTATKVIDAASTAVGAVLATITASPGLAAATTLSRVMGAS